MRRFLVDRMCGRLAGWLRLLGFDAEYIAESLPQKEIVFRSLRERRILLTRNRKISPGKGFYVYFVKSEDYAGQVKEVLDFFHIKIEREKIFTRCIRCNGELVEEDKEKVKGKVPEFVWQTKEKFYRCSACGKIYWRGSHFSLVEKTLGDRLACLLKR